MQRSGIRETHAPQSPSLRGAFLLPDRSSFLGFRCASPRRRSCSLPNANRPRPTREKTPAGDPTAIEWCAGCAPDISLTAGALIRFPDPDSIMARAIGSIAMIVKLTGKHQITFPARVLEALGARRPARARSRPRRIHPVCASDRSCAARPVTRQASPRRRRLLSRNLPRFASVARSDAESGKPPSQAAMAPPATTATPKPSPRGALFLTMLHCPHEDDPTSSGGKHQRGACAPVDLDELPPVQKPLGLVHRWRYNTSQEVTHDSYRRGRHRYAGTSAVA
jgi:hypothetical protein